MTSKNNKNSSSDPRRLEDNGAKWGSYVKQNSDQSFPYDAKMAAENPTDWLKMISERTSWLNRDSKYDYVTGEMYPRAKKNKNQNPTPFNSNPFHNAPFLNSSKPSNSNSKPSGGSGGCGAAGPSNSKYNSSKK